MTTTDQPTPEQRRIAAAVSGWEMAKHEMNCALAESLRLSLLKFSEEQPVVKGLAFETEWCYDDEGGYFMSDTVYPLIADDEGGLVSAEFDSAELDPYEFSDEFQGYGHEALAMICGVFPDDDHGEVTVEQARGMKF